MASNPLDNQLGSEDLRGRSVRGAAVTGLGQGIKFALRFGTTAILARLLTPEDYGLVAMTAVITGFAGMFKDAGLASATIQRKEITDAQISTLFWINVALGFLIALVLVAGSPLVARFYGEPKLTAITSTMAVSFIFGGLTVQHQALLRRQMRFSVLVALEVCSMVTGAISAVLMALQGFGYWSLVGMTIAAAVTNTVGAWAVLPWRPGLPRRQAGVTPLLKFGSDILGFNIVNYFARQADNLLIGWRWGPGVLGGYDRAYALLMLPIGQMNAPLAAVVMPALSRIREDHRRLESFFLSAFQSLAALAIPTVVAIVILADEIVVLWLGSGWAEVVTLFRLLGVAAVLGALSNPVGWLMVSLGHTQKYRRMGLFNSGIIVMSFAAGVRFGAEGVAVAYSIAMSIVTLPTWWYAVRGTPVRLAALLRNLAPPSLACLPAGVSAIIILNLSGASASPASRGLAGALGFVAVYSVVLLVGFKKWAFFQEIAKEFRLGLA